MQTQTRQRSTASDFAQLPEGTLCELINGELVMSPSPTYKHQRLAFALAVLLHEFAEARNAGEVVMAPMDVYFTDTDCFQPDILFVSRERLAIIRDVVHGAPDLVIEILSPSTAYNDLTRKKRVYEEHGVREYWVVDPEERSIEVYVNVDGFFQRSSVAYGTGSVGSTLLDGFVVEIENVFGSTR